MGGCNSTPNNICRVNHARSPLRLIGLVAVCSASLTLSGCNTTKAGNDSGWALYSQHCSVCHGQDGKGLIGPAIIGSDSNLENYGNAQRLLEYISSAMPQNYPGSLNKKSYQELLELLLVQNNVVPDGWNVETGNLDNITLKK